MILCIAVILNITAPATGEGELKGRFNDNLETTDYIKSSALLDHGRFSEEVQRIRKSRIDNVKQDVIEKMVEVFETRNTKLPESTLRLYATYITDAAEEYKISPFRLGSLIIAESNLNKNTTSRAGAVGLAQIMPLHLKMLKKKFPNMIRTVSDLYNPKASIYAGASIYKEYEDAVGEKYVLYRYNGVKKKYWNNPNFSYKKKIEKLENIMRNTPLNGNKSFDWETFNFVFLEPAKSSYSEEEINNASAVLGANAIVGLSKNEFAYLSKVYKADLNLSEESIKKARKILEKDCFIKSELSPLILLYSKLSESDIINAPKSLLKKISYTLSTNTKGLTQEEMSLAKDMSDEIEAHLRLTDKEIKVGGLLKTWQAKRYPKF